MRINVDAKKRRESRKNKAMEPPITRKTDMEKLEIWCMVDQKGEKKEGKVIAPNLNTYIFSHVKGCSLIKLSPYIESE